MAPSTPSVCLTGQLTYPHLQTLSLLDVEDARTNKHDLQVKINKPNQAVSVHMTGEPGLLEILICYGFSFFFF